MEVLITTYVRPWKTKKLKNEIPQKIFCNNSNLTSSDVTDQTRGDERWVANRPIDRHITKVINLPRRKWEAPFSRGLTAHAQISSLYASAGINHELPRWINRFNDWLPASSGLGRARCHHWRAMWCGRWASVSPVLARWTVGNFSESWRSQSSSPSAQICNLQVRNCHAVGLFLAIIVSLTLCGCGTQSYTVRKGRRLRSKIPESQGADREDYCLLRFDAVQSSRPQAKSARRLIPRKCW